MARLFLFEPEVTRSEKASAAAPQVLVPGRYMVYDDGLLDCNSKRQKTNTPERTHVAC